MKNHVEPFFRFSLYFLLCLSLYGQAESLCLTGFAEQTSPTSRFTAKSDNIVLDNSTDLQWSKCLEGKSGAHCDIGEVLMLTWGESLQYVSRVNQEGKYGFKDWRLANIRELSSLVELQCAHPALNVNVFPLDEGVHVWTSSPYHFYTHYSWYVDFDDGASTYDERIRKKAVWLLRDNH